MKINLTKEQYKQLIEMVTLSNGIVGVLGDMVSGEKYKKRSDKMDAMEKYLLQFAPDFGCDDLTQKHNGEVVLDGDYYENKILPTICDHEDFALHDGLANKLAWRDFRRDHTPEEIDAMSEAHHGYLGVELYDYEERYWDEFDKHEFDRLEVVEENAEKKIIRVLGEVKKET